MIQAEKISEKFRELGICVLVPTYNNAQTLLPLLNEISTFTKQIIVVNDGSTDNTLEVLGQISDLDLLTYAQNQGKGHALKLGFRHAFEKGYQYAITIDSDGQHYPADLPVFLEAIEQNPGTLFIGARNMDQASVPGKSSFGNRFSNFWFWVETGITLPDTQSGYRIYPLAQAAKMKYFTRKYELEIEAPVRLAWKGVPVRAVAVSVYYPPADERVSHFRPFRDFFRISVLNTFLTIWALAYIHPRDFLKKVFTKEGWKNFYYNVLKKPEESNLRKASSIAFGVFMGIVPIWGFQLLVGIPLSIYFRLNKGLFLLAANISVFPITPIWMALSLALGKALLGYEDWGFRLQQMSLEQFKEAGIAFFFGGTVLAISLAIITFFSSLFLLKKFRKSSPSLTSLN